MELIFCLTTSQTLKQAIMKQLFFYLFSLVFILSACTGNKKTDTTTSEKDSITSETVVSSHLKFNESTLPYDGGVLVANFGGEALSPLNSDGKGYIAYYKNDSVQVLFPADGTLNAPKGMLVLNDYLYVADVNKVISFNLKDKNQKPITLQLPAEQPFANDLVLDGKTLYISVTNTGNIYKVDVTDPLNFGTQKPELYTNVVGANGLLIDGGKMYVASYAADGLTTDKNLVYVINDMQKPNAEPLINQPGQYDGLALSSDKKTLYVTNWSPVQLEGIDLETKSISPVPMENDIQGIADITIEGNKIFVPDLVGSKLIIKELD